MRPTSKEIAECKHPNSRKAAALAKRAVKLRSKEKRKLGGLIKRSVDGEKIAWFRDNLPDAPRDVLTAKQVAELVVKYLSRFEEELAQIRAKNSIGGRRNGQHASRVSAIALTKDGEIREFRTCGLEIPDLLNAEQLALVRAWNDELRLLPNFKFRRFSINDS